MCSLRGRNSMQLLGPIQFVVSEEFNQAAYCRVHFSNLCSTYLGQV